jgi:hypothetical protein
VVRPLGILLISNALLLLSINSFAQKKLTRLDSITLKRDLDRVLAKYGLKSKGFSINVTSINQKGGQTAYSITNNYNYYRDLNYVPDSVNFIYEVYNRGSQRFFSVYPKYGIWNVPLFMHDSTKPYNAFLTGTMFDVPPRDFFNMGIKHILFGRKGGFPISKTSKLIVQMTDDPEEFFVFGDFSDPEKTYVYLKGRVIWTPIRF